VPLPSVKITIGGLCGFPGPHPQRRIIMDPEADESGPEAHNYPVGQKNKNHGNNKKKEY